MNRQFPCSEPWILFQVLPSTRESLSSRAETLVNLYQYVMNTCLTTTKHYYIMKCKYQADTAKKTATSVEKETEATVTYNRSEEDEFRKAREHIAETIITPNAPKVSGTIDIKDSYGLSMHRLPGYSTLDWKHSEAINNLKANILNYRTDSTRERPLNIIMQAEPGSGKSHFIKCLADSMSREHVEEVIFNMTAIERVDDFTKPLDVVRNLKVNDKLPLLFLDEFDCRDSNYGILLPLLWDGELQVAHRDLKVGKVVIILAGSGKNIETAMREGKGMRQGTPNSPDKLADLLSRINGGEFSIPDLDIVGEDRNRKTDKVCISIALFRRRFQEIERAPWPLLSFISRTKFRYGVRSIAHLVDSFPPESVVGNRLEIEKIGLPLDDPKKLKGSSLAYHIIEEDGPAEVVELWNHLNQKQNHIDVQFHIKKKPWGFARKLPT